MLSDATYRKCYVYFHLIFRTPNVCSQALQCMLKSVPQMLRNNEVAKVKVPHKEKMSQYALMILKKEPVAYDIIGFLDSVAFHSVCSFEATDQNSR